LDHFADGFSKTDRFRFQFNSIQPAFGRKGITVLVRIIAAHDSQLCFQKICENHSRAESFD